MGDVGQLNARSPIGPRGEKAPLGGTPPRGAYTA